MHATTGANNQVGRSADAINVDPIRIGLNPDCIEALVRMHL